jgi:hypothetical protein
MMVDAQLLRVSIVGSQPGGEEWSVNPVFSIGGDFGAPVSPAQAAAIAAAITAVSIPTDLRAVMSPGTGFDGCRVEARTMAGVLVTQAENTRTTPILGTGTSTHPFQVAIVSSLRTAYPGASGRGRLYWPATGIPIANTVMRPSSSVVLTTLTAVKAYLAGIQAAIDVTLDGVSLVVWSRKLVDANGVTSIQMGDVLDVQRRRRDTLVESVQGLAYP